MKLKGYNKMFFKAFENFAAYRKDHFNSKFMVSKKFDNIIRDIHHIYWMNDDKLLVSSDQEYNLTAMKSMFYLKFEDSDSWDKKSDSISSKDDSKSILAVLKSQKEHKLSEKRQ